MVMNQTQYVWNKLPVASYLIGRKNNRRAPTRYPLPDVPEPKLSHKAVELLVGSDKPATQLAQACCQLSQGAVGKVRSGSTLKRLSVKRALVCADSRQECIQTQSLVLLIRHCARLTEATEIHADAIARLGGDVEKHPVALVSHMLRGSHGAPKSVTRAEKVEVAASDVLELVHAGVRVMPANDPSSATRRTGRNDCNHDAPAGFAAAWLGRWVSRALMCADDTTEQKRGNPGGGNTKNDS